MDRKYTIAALLFPLMVMSSSVTLAALGDDVTNAWVDLDASYGSGETIYAKYKGSYLGGWSLSGLNGVYASEFDKTKLDLLPEGGSYDGVYEWDTAAYCVDLVQGAEFGHNYEADLINFDDPRLSEQNELGFRRAAWIMDNYSGSGDSVQNAAVQVAIWESITDSNLDLTDGDFKLLSSFHYPSNSDVKQKADEFLTAVLGADLDDLKNIYKVAYHKDYQDVLVTIPLPASVWLFGSALVGMLGFSKSRKSHS